MTIDNETILHHTFSDFLTLKRAFMPFVVGGAIFIPTQEKYQLGDFIKVMITLPESKHDYTFTGEIIWVSPQSNNHSGIGITCNEEEGRAFKNAVTEALKELKGDERDLSDTM